MKNVLAVLLSCLSFAFTAQHEFSKWYFGRFTGLDFMTSPPTVITHSTLNTSEGSASVAEANGNLLFYTDGITIWNKQQQVMANGSGLMGNSSTVQSALIVKQPGNPNIYFVFTLDLQGGPNGLRYSLVDMNLAAGMGSVTIKNATVTAPCTEQLNATRHCNGVDMWIVTHDLNSNAFKSYLLSSTGLNLAPVVSNVGMAPPTFTPNLSIGGQGTIKFSPNGKKLGLTYINGSSNSEVSVFDFDRSTGQLSNYLPLMTGTTNCYGCEFSGDGTKFYAGNTNGTAVYQWDLCAGSDASILASVTNVGSEPYGFGQLQLAPNGKIYLVNWNRQFLSTINSPDIPGLSCGFTPSAQSVATGSNGIGLPNFFGGIYKSLPAFTYTINPLISCGTVSFTAPQLPPVNSGCGASNSQVLGLTWNFGQPQSGSANTSTLNNPIHHYAVPGNYTVKLILNYSCGTDTIYNNVIVPVPSISINTNSISCTSAGGATVNISGASGPFTYTWLPTMQTGPSTTINPGTYTILIKDSNGNCNYSYTTTINPPQPMAGTVHVSGGCFGQSNGSAYLNLISGTGGTGNFLYNWSNAQNTPSISGLAPGSYSVNVTDANCVLTLTFQVVQPPAISLSIVSPTTQVCSATLQAFASGGTGSLSYSWFGGPAAPLFVTTQTFSGTNVYSVQVIDQNGCIQTASTSVNFLGSPSLTAQNRSVCANTSITLTVTGATTYTWFPGGQNGTSLALTFPASQIYTINGSYSNGCFSSTTLTLTVFQCIGLEEGGMSALLEVFPNPVFSELYMKCSRPITIVLSDVTGKEILHRELTVGINNIDMSGFSEGVYSLKITDGKKQETRHVIKAARD